MITLHKLVAQAVWPLAASVWALVAALIALVAILRVRQRLESRRSAQTNAVCKAILDSFVRGALPYRDALVQLRRLPAARLRASFEAILTGNKIPAPEWAAVLGKLCEDLGLVALWRCRLARNRLAHQTPNLSSATLSSAILRLRHPLDFVARAEAAENLGVIRHQPSWPLLVKALDDPHGVVQSAAARSLARIREPESFAALADRLESAAQDPSPTTSVRSLKMALASFPVVQASRLRHLLAHPHPRVRLAASDVVGLMVQRESAESPSGGFNASRLSPEVAEIFLTHLAVDEDADVRARAADVVAHLEPSRAATVLTPLLGDSTWFVRLHAVRALRHQGFTPLALLSQRLTDPHWRVREASVQTLFARGDSGIRRLLEHFLTTEDAYSREQVVEQIERAGLIPAVIGACGKLGRELETQFAKEMVRQGFGEVLLRASRNGGPHAKPRTLVRDLSRHPNANIDRYTRQWAGGASAEPDTPPAEESDLPASGSESLDLVEVS
jgi:HEAT repeat protein